MGPEKLPPETLKQLFEQGAAPRTSLGRRGLRRESHWKESRQEPYRGAIRADVDHLSRIKTRLRGGAILA
jgi:hypothetical protein